MTKTQRKYRIFIDASVFVAGFLSATGGSRTLCRLSKEYGIYAVTSANVVDETAEAINRYTGTPQDEAVFAFLQEHNVVIHEYISESEAEKYVSIVHHLDAHVVAGAIMTRCVFLASLDKKHLVREDVQNYFAPDLMITTPGDCLRNIRGDM